MKFEINMEGIKDKVVIVTGGSQGIGKAIAEKFAKEGASVVVADKKTKEGKETIALLGSPHQFIACDISRNKDVEHLIQETKRIFGKIDILINNAAIAIYKKLDEFEEQEWNSVIATNLNSIFLASRYCIPIMKQNGGGSIIHISSVHARTTSTHNAPYVACKGALTALTRAMALECAPHNIRVNCVLPGAIHTPMLMDNWGDMPADKHPLLPRIPLKRFGHPDEIASVVLFLASNHSSYLTGSEILVDGGLSAHFD